MLFRSQEIIIPRFVFRKEKSATSSLDVTIANKKDLSNVTGELFGIKLHAAASESDLFKGERKVQILLYSGNNLYTESPVLTLEANGTTSMEFSFKGNTEVQAALVDATNQEQLDVVVVKKSNARDFGGLF